MVVNIGHINDDDGEVKQKIQEIIVEKACTEYNENVKDTLFIVNKHLDETLEESYASLEELEEKIAARTNFLEKNPTFLNSLSYTSQSIKISSLKEFDEIKITLTEHSRRIAEKVQQIESYHHKLFDLVVKSSKEALHFPRNGTDYDGDLFQDCVEKDFKERHTVRKATERNVVKESNEKKEAVKKTPINKQRKTKVSLNKNEEKAKESLELTNKETVELSKREEHTVCPNKKTEEEKKHFNIATEELENTLLNEKDFPDFKNNEETSTVEKTRKSIILDAINEKLLSIETKKKIKQIKKEKESKKEIIYRNERNMDSKPDLNVTENKSSKLEFENTEHHVDSNFCFDNVTIQKNAFSDITLNTKVVDKLPDNFQLFPDVIPEVQRGRPLQNLHKRLIQQIEATDSLEGFIRLMERKPPSATDKGKKNNDVLEGKFDGSLWFFSGRGLKKKLSKTILTTTSQEKGPKIIKILRQDSACCNHVNNSQTSTVTNFKEKIKKTKSNMDRVKLKCYDLLDDINFKDLKPIKSEYPRKDNVFINLNACKEKLKLHETRTYLHLMMEEENEKVWKKLLQSTDYNIKKMPVRKKRSLKIAINPSENKMKNKSIRNLYLARSPENERPQMKQNSCRNITNLIEFLTSPAQRFANNRPQSVVVMPVMVTYDNFTGSPENQKLELEKQKSYRNATNLIEYLTSPEQRFLNTSPQTLDVMPVKVTYDNFSMKERQPKPIEYFKYPDLNAKTPSPKQPSVVLKAHDPHGGKTSEIKNVMFPLPVHHVHLTCLSKEKSPQRTDSARSSDGKSKKNEPKINLTVPIQKKREMLEQIKKYKTHNEVLQKNIQNAIDVIELKMIDLLSSSSESENSKAFYAMEDGISRVLEMIRNDQAVTNTDKIDVKKVEKPETDKDDNEPKKNIKFRKGITMIKKADVIYDGTPMLTEVPLKELHISKEKDNKEQEQKHHTKQEQKQQTKQQVKQEQKQQMKLEQKQYTKQESKTTDKKNDKEIIVIQEYDKNKNHDSKRRAANIEEGERLLGQVDNVIKKIDNIYAKFYDDSKMKQNVTKRSPEEKNALNNVINFFTDLNTFVKQQPQALEYMTYENVSDKFQTPKTHCQARVYHKVQKSQILDEAKKENDCKKKKSKENLKKENPKKENLKKENPKKEDTKVDEVTMKNDNQNIKKDGVETEKESIMNNESDAVDDMSETTCISITESPSGKKIRNYQIGRHEATLQAFYALFFSSIFFLLNFDYSA